MAAAARGEAAQVAPEPSSAAPLRVSSWNIGLRGLQGSASCSSSAEYGAPDVHGISRSLGFSSVVELLSSLEADVVCLQEIKLKELGAPERHLALAAGWESYFALCRTQTANTSYGRYSGVATFCRTAVRPRLAEEGLTGVHATSGCAVGHAASLAERWASETLREVDSEGRCMLTVHGDLAIFNVYCPAITCDAEDDPEKWQRRVEFKATFLAALEERSRSLLATGLRVLIIGDMNIAPERIDSARRMEAGAPAEPLEPSPSRDWLAALLRQPQVQPRARAHANAYGYADSDSDGVDEAEAEAQVRAQSPFVDAFRALHPLTRNAYTCFHVASGADTSNYGSRIDLALLAPPPKLESSVESSAEGHAAAHASVPLLLEACFIQTSVPRCSDHLPLQVVVRGVDLPATPPAQLAIASTLRLGGQRLLTGFVQREGESSTQPTQQPQRQRSIGGSGSSSGGGSSGSGAPPGLLAFFNRPPSAGATSAGAASLPPVNSKAAACSSAGSIGSSADGGGGVAAWQHLLKKVEDKVPLCRHGVKCRSQSVKKAGPNQGRQFYSCPHAEGPKSDPGSNCGFFKWAVERPNDAKRKRVS